MLKVDNISLKNTNIDSISFTVNKGDVFLLSGPSGAGKSTLLKCLAQLVPYDSGSVYFHDLSPDDMTTPVWRTHVLYVPQEPARLAGTPRDLWTRILGFRSWYSQSFHGKNSQAPRSSSLFGRLFSLSSPRDPTTLMDCESTQDNYQSNIPSDPVKIGITWNLPIEIWDREWNRLSGGECQRAALAINVALMIKHRQGNGILLLDEPTSAVDSETVLKIEDTLLNNSLTLMWVTHSQDQAQRIRSSPGGGQIINLTPSVLAHEE